MVIHHNDRVLATDVYDDLPDAHPPRMSEYKSVKAGVVALSETLTHELKSYGVAVSVICPTFQRPIILADRNGRTAYAAKRFARPLYDRAMARASKQMASQDT